MNFFDPFKTPKPLCERPRGARTRRQMKLKIIVIGGYPVGSVDK